MQHVVTYLNHTTLICLISYGGEEMARQKIENTDYQPLFQFYIDINNFKIGDLVDLNDYMIWANEHSERYVKEYLDGKTRFLKHNIEGYLSYLKKLYIKNEQLELKI